MRIEEIQGYDQAANRYAEIAKPETWDIECSFAKQALSNNKYLAEQAQKHPLTLLQAIYSTATCKLTLDPVKQFAALVPRRNGVTLMPMYQGLVKLLTDTGAVRAVYAYAIHENDEFVETLGTSVDIIHKPARKDRGEVQLYYAVGILPTGEKMVETMSIEEIESIRDGSDSWKAFQAKKVRSCVWSEWPGEMSRKTVLKRLCKYLPKSTGWDEVAQAIELDNQEYKPSLDQIQLAEALIRTANLSEDNKGGIEYELSQSTLSAQRVSQIINYLNENQLDRFRDLAAPSSAELVKKTKELFDEG